MWAETIKQAYFWKRFKISIHSARVGGDRYPVTVSALESIISIHSARVGGDGRKPGEMQSENNFNPLRPCGRRLQQNSISTV